MERIFKIKKKKTKQTCKTGWLVVVNVKGFLTKLDADVALNGVLGYFYLKHAEITKHANKRGLIYNLPLDWHLLILI